MEIDPKKMDFDKIKSGSSPRENVGANRVNDIGGINNANRANENAEHNNSSPYFTPPSNSAPTLNSNQPFASLQKPTELLSEAWQLYKARWKTFLGIVAIPILLIFFIVVIFGIGIGILGESGLLPKFSVAHFDTNMLIIIFISFFILFIPLFIIQIWSQAALIYAIKEGGEIGIKEAYQKSKSKIKQFFWVSLLAGFITMGGFIFFAIPGFIFGVWFAFATFIVIAEDLKGMDAILKSREYVRNYWWPVFWRFLFINIVMMGIMIVLSIALMLIPFLGNLVSIVITPLIMIYLFLIYDNLRKIKGNFEFKPSSGLKKKFVAIGILGFIIMPLFFLSTIALVSLNSAKNKAMDVARRSDISQLEINLIMHYYEEGKYPKSLSEFDDAGYFKDPKTKESYEYRQLDNGDDYELCVQFEETGRECFYSEESSYKNSGEYNYNNDINNIKEELLNNSIIGRDSQRISDLDSISQILSLYKIENGIYPVSQTTVHLNKDNYIASEMQYFIRENIPVDPKDPEYYYSYQSSDGKNFELTARLENINNSDCDLDIKEASNICIYKLQN